MRRIISVFAAFAPKEKPMADDPTSSPAPAGVRAQRRARRARRTARQERYFGLMLSGYTLNQIAKMAQASAASVRREIDRAIAERRLDAPERFARVQVARLAKALRLAEAAIELGELKAVGTYLRVIAALDRYHELPSSNPPHRPAGAPPLLALPTPPKALAFAPLADDEPSAADEEARGVADEFSR
jgi:hypothetical protein